MDKREKERKKPSRYIYIYFFFNGIFSQILLDHKYKETHLKHYNWYQVLKIV